MLISKIGENGGTGMIKALKWGKQHIFSITIFVIIGFVLLSRSLALLHLRFRVFVFQVFVVIALLGILIGIIQLIRRQSNKAARAAAYIATVAVLVAGAFFMYLPAVLFFLGQTETTVYIDGVKYSAHTYEFLDRFVYYYDYKNFLISGNVLRMEDDYPGCIIGDPIRTVYDEYGNGTVIQGEGG